MKKFEIGDWVYASNWCYGQIVDIGDDYANVEFSSERGGGCLPFDFDELTPAPNPAELNPMRVKLRNHIGHRIVCVYYGDESDPADVCIECEDCCEVLISAEDYDI